MVKKDKWRIFSLVTTAYIVLMAIFLLICPQYENLIAVKQTAFYVICGGFAGLILLLCIESIIIGELKLKDILQKLKPNSLLQIFMLTYLAFSLISTVFSKYREAWIGATRHEGFLTIAIYVLCFYFVAKFFKAQKWMMYAFGIAVTVTGIISIIQFSGCTFLYPEGYNYYDAYKEYSGAFTGTIGNVDFVAAFYSLCIPALCLYVIKASEKTKYLLLIPALLSVAVLLKIWVLLGIIGVMAATVLSLPFVFSLKKRGLVIYWSTLFALALGGVLMLYFIPLGGVFGEIHNILRGNISESFGTGRIRIWSEVIRRAGENIWIGSGPDTMIYAKIEPFYRLDEVHGDLYALIDTAHNEYLNILYHQGIFATASYIGAAAMVVINFFKNASKNKGTLIFGGAVIGYLVSAFFGISTSYVTSFFWLCLGIFEYYFNKKEEIN